MMRFKRRLSSSAFGRLFKVGSVMAAAVVVRRIESSLSSMSANLLMSGAAPFGAFAVAAFGSLAAAGARSVPRPVLAAPAGYASAYDFLPSLTSYRDSPIFGEKRAPSATMLAAPAPQREAPIAAARATERTPAAPAVVAGEVSQREAPIAAAGADTACVSARRQW